jgi:hypothetical protein
MFGFIKKLFGFDKDTLEAAGVKIEQTSKTETVNSQITDAVTAPAVKLPIDNPVEKPKKKRQFAKKPAAATAAPKAAKPRGRKPKAKN